MKYLLAERIMELKSDEKNGFSVKRSFRGDGRVSTNGGRENGIPRTEELVIFSLALRGGCLLDGDVENSISMPLVAYNVKLLI